MLAENQKPLEIQLPNNNPVINTITDINAELTEEPVEDNISTNTNSNRSLCKIRPKVSWRKKSSELCNTLSLFEQKGSIYTLSTPSKQFIARIQKITFPDSRDLFDKGRQNSDIFYRENISSIPEITFWHQRYYYYNKFDDGIKMDKESILY